MRGRISEGLIFLICCVRCAAIDKEIAKNPLKSLISEDFWSEWQDSNLRHRGPKPRALPAALHPEVVRRNSLYSVSVLRRRGRSFLPCCSKQRSYYTSSPAAAQVLSVTAHGDQVTQKATLSLRTSVATLVWQSVSPPGSVGFLSVFVTELASRVRIATSLRSSQWHLVTKCKTCFRTHGALDGWDALG